MNDPLQTTIALGVVAATVVLLVYTSWKKRKSPGCGSGCCPTDNFKTKLKK